MRSTPAPRTREAGFSLVELMVVMVIVSIVMAATMTALTNAYRSNDTAKAILDVNSNLRTGLDIMVRDFIQVGQGLPTARTIQVPSGTGAVAIQRPHPQGAPTGCTEWPADITTLPAVTVGPGCGPTINNVATDMVTTLAVDAMLDAKPVYSFDLTGRRATVATAAQATGGLDVSTGSGDDIEVGDLMMFTKGSASALVYVTAFDGAQTFTYASGDPMNLNQTATTLVGRVDDLANAAPTTANSAQVSRVRMISYYLDNTLDSNGPRLIRHLGWGVPSAPLNQRGRTVALNVDNLQITYDIADGKTNPSNVKMNATDLGTSGACNPAACSPNQIRKINVYVAARSNHPMRATGRFFRNSLSTQVSFRSLALVDRYR